MPSYLRSERDEFFATSMAQVVASALSARSQTRAEAAARRAFLDAFGRELVSLDAREIARRAVSLAAPMVSAALVWVQNREGALECIAFQHVDPEKQTILAQFLASPIGAPHPAAAHLYRVLRQGHSLLVPDVKAMTLDSFGFGPAERAVIERLGVGALMVAPLTAGGRTFGTMSFLVEHRRVDPEDLALAGTIADRVAAALENARLYGVAREAVRARDELLELTAHELHTPLTALALRTEHQLRAAERRADAVEVERGQAVVSDVRRFTAVVDHVLDALNIRARGVTPTPSRCDLTAIVRSAATTLSARARHAGSTISVDCDDAIPGRWDQAQLRKVVDVLLDNAIKFGSGGPIVVSAHADGGIELRVTDHGIGIPSDRVPAIFNPFERAVPKEHFGGLGLGLYIARAIVEAHGGTLTATSRPGEGSTFMVQLPR